LGQPATRLQLLAQLLAQDRVLGALLDLVDDQQLDRAVADVGGLVPLSPYFFVDTPVTGLKISAALTLLCLFIFGWFKSKITGIQPWGGALRVMLIGAVAAGAAFGVAKLFEG